MDRRRFDRLRGPEAGEKQSDPCFNYTDGLLDDLCAIKYLGGRYNKAVVLLQAPARPARNQMNRP